MSKRQPSQDDVPSKSKKRRTELNSSEELENDDENENDDSFGSVVEVCAV